MEGGGGGAALELWSGPMQHARHRSREEGMRKWRQRASQCHCVPHPLSPPPLMSLLNAADANLSIALFAPGWTYECRPADSPFLNHNLRCWVETGTEIMVVLGRCCVDGTHRRLFFFLLLFALVDTTHRFGFALILDHYMPIPPPPSSSP